MIFFRGLPGGERPPPVHHTDHRPPTEDFLEFTPRFETNFRWGMCWADVGNGLDCEASPETYLQCVMRRHLCKLGYNSNTDFALQTPLNF